MKKQLLCTSAIALGVAAAPAAAQDWNLDWGGFFNSHVAFVDASGAGLGATDFDGIGKLTTGEIIFTPSITLDNGLTFGVNVQYEAQNNGGGAAGIDESYMTISSDTFGLLILGGENSAGYLLSTGASGVTSMSVNSPSISAFVPVTPTAVSTVRNSMFSSFTEVAQNNDVPRITYMTPDFNGLTVGVSYARNGSVGGAITQSNGVTAGQINDIFDIGVNYSGSFGTTDVVLSARYGTGDIQGGAVTSDPETWGVGANVTFGQFGVAASYGEDKNANGSLALATEADTEGYSFGVYYDPAGPWTFSLTTYQGEEEVNNVKTAEYSNYALMGRRNLGPGVNWDVYAIFTETDFTNNALDVEGTIIGTGIALGF